MAWSYSNDPEHNSKDAVRFLIQDVDGVKKLVQDEEIAFALANEHNIYMAAASICDSLILRAGNVKSKKISEFSITYDPSFYLMVSARLRARGSSHQTAYAGGISFADKNILSTDPDWVPAALPRGLDDNSAAPSPVVPSSNPLTTI